MEALFLKILNLSISAIWVVLAVLILRVVLQKAPKALRVVLWGVVGLRLVWPFSIESVLSLIPSAETVPADIGMAKEPAIHSGIAIVNSSINPVLGETMAATPQYSANPMQIVQFIATWVWVIGMVLMAFYALISWLVVRIRVREAMREEGNVWLCDRIGSPFILGLFSPRIYLPSDTAAEDLPYVLAHERAHLKRRDHLWKPLGFALLTVHWFNPAVWLAYILLCRDIELACDEKVLSLLGEEGKKPYSEALIHCSVPRRMITACPVAFGETGVKARIKSVLNYKKPVFWIILVAIIACIAVAVCFLTDPVQNESPTEPPELTVSSWEDSQTAWRGGYSWSYEQNGETVHTIADADHPTAVAGRLPRIEARPSTVSSRRSNTLGLAFGLQPDSITVVAHALENTDSSGGSVTATADGFDLLVGEYVYIIQATWEDHGTAQYAFVGSYDEFYIIRDMAGEVVRLRAKLQALDEDYHMLEQADEWGVSMKLEFTSGTAFRLTLSTDGRSVRRLTTGSDFSLIRYGADGKVEQLVSLPGTTWDALAHVLPAGGQLELEGDLEAVYGDLTPGSYQLQKTIYRDRSDGSTEKRVCTCDFAIVD